MTVNPLHEFQAGLNTLNRYVKSLCFGTNCGVIVTVHITVSLLIVCVVLALYHYEIRRIRKNEEAIIRDRIADALLNDPRRSFWTKVRKIRNKQSAVSSVIDGCNDADSIAQLFARKYKELYSSFRLMHVN